MLPSLDADCEFLSAGNRAIVDALVTAGAALEAPSSAGTPMLWAAGSGQAETVEALLAHGCQRNVVTEDGVGAALMAAAMGKSLPPPPLAPPPRFCLAAQYRSMPISFAKVDLQNLQKCFNAERH